jgi:hypothetical protein
MAPCSVNTTIGLRLDRLQWNARQGGSKTSEPVIRSKPITSFLLSSSDRWEPFLALQPQCQPGLETHAPTCLPAE